MSGSVGIVFGDQVLWATSTGTMVLLAAMLDCLENRADFGWLEPVAERWRVQACIRDLGMTLDPNWSKDEVQDVVDLIGEATSWLTGKGTLGADELNNWIVVDGMHVDHDMTFTRPLPLRGVLDIAQAVTDLLTGTLPEAPDGGWWFVGTDAGRTALPRRH